MQVIDSEASSTSRPGRLPRRAVTDATASNQTLAVRRFRPQSQSFRHTMATAFDQDIGFAGRHESQASPISERISTTIGANRRWGLATHCRPLVQCVQPPHRDPPVAWRNADLGRCWRIQAHAARRAVLVGSVTECATSNEARAFLQTQGDLR
jgi:hypothetical protein